jgi:DNA-binding transcriptional LysR family regulator
MIEVRDLHLVRAIVDNGSLVRAARVLGMGQPALTRALAALEARLRGPLFERNRRGVIATDLCRALLLDAEEILDRLARLDRFLAESRGDQVQDLTVIAGAYAAESLGLAAASRMPALFPRLRLRLVPTNWAEVQRAILNREAPIGLLDLRGGELDSGLEMERLRPQPGIFVARPGHPLAGRTRLELADILAFPMVSIGRNPAAVQAPLATAREQARQRGALHPAFPALVCESPTLALAAVQYSDAVAPVTHAIAAGALRTGQVVPLAWRAPWVSIHPGVIRLRNRRLSEAEQGFLDLVRDINANDERDAQAWFHGAGLNHDCS